MRPHPSLIIKMHLFFLSLNVSFLAGCTSIVSTIHTLQFVHKTSKNNSGLCYPGDHDGTLTTLTNGRREQSTSTGNGRQWEQTLGEVTLFLSRWEKSHHCPKRPAVRYVSLCPVTTVRHLASLGLPVPLPPDPNTHSNTFSGSALLITRK